MTTALIIFLVIISFIAFAYVVTQIIPDEEREGYISDYPRGSLSQLELLVDNLFTKHELKEVTTSVWATYDLTINFRFEPGTYVSLKYNAVRRRFYGQMEIYVEGELIESFFSFTSSSYNRILNIIAYRYPKLLVMSGKHQKEFDQKEKDKNNKKQKIIDKYAN